MVLGTDYVSSYGGGGHVSHPEATGLPMSRGDKS